MQRISALATRSCHEDIVGISTTLIQAKVADARNNARLREIHCFHTGDDDPLHRMLNAFEPGSYVRPHRHSAPPKPESIIILCGRLGIIQFLDDGTPDWERAVLLSRDTDTIGADIRAGVWDTLVALESGTVYSSNPRLDALGAIEAR